MFRSAERLLASPPKKPARKLPARSVVFLLGLAVGIGSAFWWLRPARESISDTVDGNAATSSGFVGRKRLNLPLTIVNPTFGAAAPRFPSATTGATDPSSPAADTDLRSGTASGVTPRPSAPGTATPAVRAGVPTTPATILMRFTSRFKLRGELRSTSAKSIPVEFELFLLPDRVGGSVTALVSFTDDPNQVGPVTIFGRWLSRTITLHQGERSPIGRTFVIEFPAIDADDEFTGLWSYNGAAGTLVLKSALLL